MNLVSILGMFDKLDDIVYMPLKVASDWCAEPLKARQHRRDMETKKQEEQSKTQEKDHELILKIKEQTEIPRINAEIEQWKKDKEFQRMKAVSEAIMRFQMELNQLNVDAIGSIGNMQLDLREKAQNMIYDKTIKYKELQDCAMQEAMDDLKKIEEKFPNNPMAQDMMLKAIDKRLANIIDTAHKFLLELNNDIKQLNSNIDSLSQSGQIFIEKHLTQFHVIGFSQDEDIKRLSH